MRWQCYPLLRLCVKWEAKSIINWLAKVGGRRGSKVHDMKDMTTKLLQLIMGILYADLIACFHYLCPSVLELNTDSIRTNTISLMSIHFRIVLMHGCIAYNIPSALKIGFN